jgi:hypothetical protein
VSRGPGCIQRVIEAVFRDNPSATYSAAELAALAYPGAVSIEKKHRVATIRAADAAAHECRWWRAPAERTSHVIYGNPVNIRSYAMWKLRCMAQTNEHNPDQMAALLDDPNVPQSRWRWLQPGGWWWKHVEINKLREAGFEEEAQRQIAAVNRLAAE